MPLILYLRPRRDEDPLDSPTVLFAIAADALVMLQMRQDPRYAGWRVYGTPTQPQHLFLLTRPDCTPADVPLECGRVGWALLAPSDLEEFPDIGEDDA